MVVDEKFTIQKRLQLAQQRYLHTRLDRRDSTAKLPKTLLVERYSSVNGHFNFYKTATNDCSHPQNNSHAQIISNFSDY
jgi:hypothetical protein